MVFVNPPAVYTPAPPVPLVAPPSPPVPTMAISPEADAPPTLAPFVSRTPRPPSAAASLTPPPVPFSVIVALPVTATSHSFIRLMPGLPLPAEVLSPPAPVMETAPSTDETREPFAM